MSDGELIDSFGSDYVRVQVRTHADGFEWSSEPGPVGPGHLGARVPRQPHPIGTPQCRWVWPTTTEHGLRFQVPGPSAAARWLSSPVAEQFDAAHRPILAAADSLAGPALESVEPVGDDLPAPVRRLLTHLDRPHPGSATRRWREACRDELGQNPWEEMLTRVREHYLQPRGAVQHGGLSIGGIVPATVGGPPALLTGPDIGRAPRGHDLGWLSGELVELAVSQPSRAERLRILLCELVALHGGAASDLVLPAVARVLLHGEDYAAHVGWHESLLSRAAIIARLTSTPAGSVVHGGWLVVF